MKKVFYILGFILTIQLNAQVPSPIESKHKTILIQNGRAHIGNGEVVQKASIGIKNGKIEFVKNALTYTVVKSEWDTIIDVVGKEVYPGFIAPNTTIGLSEIDAVRATNDFNETGLFNPNVRSIIAYNTDSKIIYTVRTNGVLVCQSAPRGGIISGSSSIMALDGWNWEDAVYKEDDGIHLYWPEKYRNMGWWAEPGEIKENEKYKETIESIYTFFQRAKAYSDFQNSNNLDLKLEAMKGVFNGNKRVYIHVDFAPEINDVIDFSRKFNLNYPVIVGGYDAYFLAERLKENKFTVMLHNPHSLPEFEGESPQITFELPYKLFKAGVLFCLQNEGDMDMMKSRNLPFLAGTAMAYGLTEEQAIACLTINTAKIMGIDDKIGSLEKGKDATLFVSEGNALDMRTNNVKLALIKGNFIQLTNHQMKLSETYHKKYGMRE